MRVIFCFFPKYDKPHSFLTVLISFFSAVCGDNLPGDSGHVPRYHQCDDVSHWEPCAAYRGIFELNSVLSQLDTMFNKLF